MSNLRSRVQAGVDRAFKKVDSLLLDAIFTNKEVKSFDFNESKVVAKTSTFTTRGFLEEKQVWVGDGLASKTLFLIKTGGIKFNGYTFVTINSIKYSFSVYKGNEYTTYLELVRIE